MLGGVNTFLLTRVLYCPYLLCGLITLYGFKTKFLWETSLYSNIHNTLTHTHCRLPYVLPLYLWHFVRFFLSRLFLFLKMAAFLKKRFSALHLIKKCNQPLCFLLQKWQMTIKFEIVFIDYFSLLMRVKSISFSFPNTTLTIKV